MNPMNNLLVPRNFSFRNGIEDTPDCLEEQPTVALLEGQSNAILEYNWASKVSILKEKLDYFNDSMQALLESISCVPNYVESSKALEDSIVHEWWLKENLHCVYEDQNGLHKNQKRLETELDLLQIELFQEKDLLEYSKSDKEGLQEVFHQMCTSQAKMEQQLLDAVVEFTCKN